MPITIKGNDFAIIKIIIAKSKPRLALPSNVKPNESGRHKKKIVTSTASTMPTILLTFLAIRLRAPILIPALLQVNLKRIA
jgi:hypothetical protein